MITDIPQPPPRQGEWRAAEPGERRGPCPALNALANAGHIPRSGRVAVSDLVRAMEQHLDLAPSMKFGLCLVATYVGMQFPFLFLKNKIARRKLSVIRAFPDALDLLLICVESGMSIEAAFRRVSEEIGSQSIPLCEELTLTTAELSYLPANDFVLTFEDAAGGGCAPHFKKTRAHS